MNGPRQGTFLPCESAGLIHRPCYRRNPCSLCVHRCSFFLRVSVQFRAIDACRARGRRRNKHKAQLNAGHGRSWLRFANNTIEMAHLSWRIASTAWRDDPARCLSVILDPSQRSKPVELPMKLPQGCQGVAISAGSLFFDVFFQNAFDLRRQPP